MNAAPPQVSPPIRRADPPRWRLVLGDGDGAEPLDGPSNMALDAALLATVADGALPVVRLYRWSPATLSFGRNQPARGLYDEQRARRRGIAFVRRPTGGQAVLHDVELTYAVIAPVSSIGKPRDAYRRINEGLVTGLRAVGLPTAVAGAAAGAAGGSDPEGARAIRGPGPPVAPSWTDACFRRPARGEVVVGGRKLVGSAQRTRGRTILQHGSILLGGSQAAAEELLVEQGQGQAAGARGRAEQGWTTVERETGRRPAPGELVPGVVEGLESVLGVRLVRGVLSAAETAGARELRGRFASAEWTWRR